MHQRVLLLTLHPYGLPCQWTLCARWMADMCVPGCWLCILRPFFRLPKQDTAIQLEPDPATPLLPFQLFLPPSPADESYEL